MEQSKENREREKGIYKVTLTGSFVNFILVIIKFLAGILGNSAAMTADAVHSLSDFVTDVIVVVFIKISSKPRDHDHNYGHGKFETLATLMVGFFLFIVGAGIAWNGGNDIVFVIRGGTLESPGRIALAAAIISIISKEALYRYTIIKGRKLNSDVVVANAWHHRSDAFSSVGTALGIGGAIFLGAKWTILDPIAALVVSVFIIITAVRLMKPALDELLEKSLPDEVEKEIEDIVMACGGVSHLHNLRTRKIGSYYALEFHIRMDSNTSLSEAHKKMTEIENRLRECYGGNTFITIHMEPA